MNRKLGIAVSASVAFSGLAVAQDVVGSIANSRGASVSNTPTSPGARYADAQANQRVRNGDGVRTARRGFAQITFNDKSALRLSELTELIVQDSITLRRLQLSKGALWVRVTKGSNTSVQTPVATATVRGTEFLIDEAGNLAVREGSVDLEAGGFTIEVFPGEVAGVGPDGKPFKRGVRIPTDPEADPAEFGIPSLWWRRLKGEGDLPPETNRDATQDILGGIAGALPLMFFPNSGGGDTISAVPEPATTAGLLLGVGAMAGVLRKKRGR